MLGNKARVRRDVRVDTSGWFVLALADTAFGGDGALLDERSPTTSLTLGDTFVYGRGAAWVKGRARGTWLFRDIDLSLHLDTRRWSDDVFFRDALDPDRTMPSWGDSALEVLEARSALPIFVELTADDSRLSVGNVRTELVGGDLLRYQRARTGAQLRFDRGWLDPIDVTPRRPPSTTPGVLPLPRTPAASDPWRTQAMTFVAGGGDLSAEVGEIVGDGT
jgi:hypothetical protein